MVRLVQIFLSLLIVWVCAAGANVSSPFEAPLKEHLQKNLGQFNKFVEKYDKVYTSRSERLRRLEIFSDNLKKIELFNKISKGHAKFGINDMTDWSEEEFLQKRANLNPDHLKNRLKKQTEYVPKVGCKIPFSKDWRAEGKVTAVKDQGECGSCYAFSTAAMIESVHAIKSGTIVPLSEQQIIDCDSKSQGCKGGWMENAIESVVKLGGLNTLESYPYTGQDGTCKYNSSNNGAKIKQYGTLPSYNEFFLKYYVGVEGPTSHAMNANLLQHYESGIIFPSLLYCFPFTVNHSALNVGYGVENGIPYWIFKNSWGTAWGESGYFKLLRGTNTCGMARYINCVKTE